MINPSIFKAYDIRGIYNQDFSDDFAYKLGLAYCQLRREELGWDSFTVVAGHDMRVSSPALYKELIRGLVDGGADVVDCGLLSTPAFYFAVAHFKRDGGIMISASHNPKNYNGFKLVRQMASPIGEYSGIQDLKRLILDEQFVVHQKTGTTIKQENIFADQAAFDTSFVDLKKIKPFKIVIDTANAMGAPYFDQLLKHVPQLEVSKMNWELDGTFPNHEADPFKPENVKSLCERVIAEKADLGIATDGDEDRIFFIDEKGIPVQPGITRAILCKLFLQDKPGATIAYDIRPGKITLDTIIANGGQPLVTRVGHSLIKEAVIDSGAYFAGESSGHFCLNMEGEGCYEVPGIVMLKLLSALSKVDQPLSEYAQPYEKYFSSGEINLKVEDADAKINLLRDKFSDLPAGRHGGKINTLDGLSVEYPDVWFNVRKSNTEPLLRVSIEGNSQKIVEETKKTILQIVS